MKTSYTLIVQMIACILFTAYARANIVMVEVEDFEFNPQVVTVNVGDTIQWFWEEGFHTTTSTIIPAGAAPWDQVISSTSPVFQYVVNVPGSYDYVCTPHASIGMVGHFTAIGSTTNIPEPTTADLDFEWFVNGNELTITTSFSKSVDVEIKLLNLNGQLLKSLNQTLVNQNSVFSFGIGNPPKGIYLVQIASEKGSNTRRISIQ